MLLALQCSVANCAVYAPNFENLCLRCENEYSISENMQQCESAEPGCQAACASCPNGPCIKCADYYGLTQLGVCTPCPESDCIHCVEAEQGEMVCQRYFLDGQSGACQNCDFCLNSECLQCTEQAQFVDGLCVVCADQQSRCSECSSLGACLECKSPFLLENDSCHSCQELIPNCDVCTLHLSGVWLCSQCMPGFTPTLLSYGCGKCLVEVAHCLECADYQPDLCALCDLASGYFPENGYCERRDCAINTFSFNGTCRSCDYFMPGCATCESKSVCNECSPGYLKTSSGVCGLCGEVTHCAECDEIDTTECVSCSSPYVLRNGTCVHENCSIECIVCEDDGKCAICADGYIEERGNCVSCGTKFADCVKCTEYECVECESGFYVQEGVCKAACSSECLECNDGLCVRCIEGYFVLHETCHLCADYFPNCQACDKASCTTCDSAFQLIEGSCFGKSDNCLDYSQILHTCLRCDIGYFSVQGACFSCSNHCAQCGDEAACEKCEPGYLLSPDSKCFNCTNDENCVECDVSGERCGACHFPYVLTLQQTCSLPYCAEECVMCVDRDRCEACVDGYVVFNGECIKDLCKQRDEKERCLECGSGYSLADGVCLKASEKQAIVIASAVGATITVSGLSVLAALRIRKVRFLRKQLRQKQPEPATENIVRQDDIEQAERIMSAPRIKKSFSEVLDELQKKK